MALSLLRAALFLLLLPARPNKKYWPLQYPPPSDVGDFQAKPKNVKTRLSLFVGGDERCSEVRAVRWGANCYGRGR
jgi:hypothetical protein